VFDDELCELTSLMSLNFIVIKTIKIINSTQIIHTMENYTKVPKAKDQENISPNEIRITSTGKTRRYISYSVALLDPTLLQQDDEDDKEQKEQQKDQKIYDSIVLKGMGQAINKTVTIAEVIKRRVKGLHQLNEIHSTTITDEWEPKEEGLEKHSTTRTVSAISITLSKLPLNVNDPGYQSPIAADLVQPMQKAIPKKKRAVPTEESTTGAEATTASSDDKEAKQQRRKKKPQQRRKKPAAEKTGGEEASEQKQDETSEAAPAKTENPKSDKPKRRPANKKPRAPKESTSTEGGDQQQQEQQQEGGEEKSESTRGAKRTRGGGKRYSRGGYKKKDDAAQQGSSDSATSGTPQNE
jgi:DNA-binding protein